MENGAQRNMAQNSNPRGCNEIFFDVVLRYRFRPKLKSNYMDAESVTPVHRQTMIENIFLHYVHEALQGA